MGGGPRTPPDLYANVDSRSSEDLVEVTLRTEAVAFDSATPSLTAGSSASSASPTASDIGTATPSPTQLYDAQMGEKLLPATPLATDHGRVAEGGLAELLWSKSAVYLAPSPSTRDNLPGFLSVVRVRESADEGQGEARWKHLLSWVPENVAEGLRDVDAYVLVELSSQNERDVLVHVPHSFPEVVSPPDASSTSHAFSYPLTSLYSVFVQPPTLTCWVGSVTVSLFGGVTLPPLHFHDDESRSTVLAQDQRASSLGSSSSPSSRTGRSPSMPPSWGGEALMSQLRQHTLVVRSELDPQVYLINPSRLDLDAHISGGATTYGAHEDDAVPDEAMNAVRARLGEGERGERAKEREEQRKRQQKMRTSLLHQASPVGMAAKGKGKEKDGEDWPDDLAALPADARDNGGMDALTFSVLSGFSKITRGARQMSQQAASTVLSHPLAKPLAKHVPKPIAQFALAPGEVTRLAATAGVGTYDSARVYLAKWAKIVAEEGERARRAEYGVDDGSFLEEELGESTGMFEVLSRTYLLEHKPRSTRAPRTPIQLEEWHAWFDVNDGTLLLDEAEARRRIFQRGLSDDEVRKEAWPFLLKVFPWDSTREERRKIEEARSTEFEHLKRSWMQDSDLEATERFQEEDHRVEIDCRRTDRTHPLFALDLPPGAEPEGAHPPTNAHVMACKEVLMTWVFAPEYSDTQEEKLKVGIEGEDGVRNYVQGMSDLFSPLYVVLDGCSWLAYACFETVMERQQDNFRSDQSGMKRQLMELQGLIRVMDRGLYRHFEETGSLNLFFCFRWLLTSFKRELTWNQTVELWENFFTDHLGTHFHLFFALAILEANRDVMIRYLKEFDEVLQYINNLSGTLDLQVLLSDAEVLYHTFAAVVDSVSPAPVPALGEEGLRQRKGRGSKTGKFPPTKEDAEEQRRERVRERTRREGEGLKVLLE
ncbi:hypothetical protein JCM11641_001482 [Rhodosporidiobolus odoratus]